MTLDRFVLMSNVIIKILMDVFKGVVSHIYNYWKEKRLICKMRYDSSSIKVFVVRFNVLKLYLIFFSTLLSALTSRSYRLNNF